MARAFEPLFPAPPGKEFLSVLVIEGGFTADDGEYRQLTMLLDFAGVASEVESTVRRTVLGVRIVARSFGAQAWRNHLASLLAS